MRLYKDFQPWKQVGGSNYNDGGIAGDEAEGWLTNSLQ